MLFPRKILAPLLIPLCMAPGAGAEERADTFRQRPDPLRHSLGDTASFEAEFEADPESYRNLDLNRGREDRLSFSKFKLTPTLLIKPAPTVDVMLEGRWESERVFEDLARQENNKALLSLREAYILYEPEAGTGAMYQIGRHRFRDDREWLFDEFLDAVRFMWRHNGWKLDFSQSAVLIDPKEKAVKERIVNTMTFLSYEENNKLQRLYVIERNDQLSPWQASWSGLQLRGGTDIGVSYRLDSAWRRGTDGTRELAGYGADGGVTWTAQSPWRPSLTFAYAYGSGDAAPKKGTDKTFRQTGMQDNHGSIAGIDNFQYYGIVLDPELSNIAITTLAAGIRPTERSSVELVWHHYERNEAASKIKTQLTAAPEMPGQRIGDEIDLLLAYRAKGWRGNIGLGWFRPDEVYRGTDSAWGLSGEVRVYF